MILTKLKAFLIHLLLSISFVSLMIINIIYFWYPIEYLGITSFKEIVLLIISVDLILGPLLTFVVFNPTKKSLRFDLAVIALFQLSALAYGSYTLFETHPVYLTYSEGSFNLISAKDVQPKKAKHEEYKISKLQATKLAYTKTPSDLVGLADVTQGNMTKGAQKLEQRVEFYQPYKSHTDEILSKTLDSTQIFSDKDSSKEAIEFLSKHEDIDNFVFLPLRGSSKDAIIVLDKQSAKPAGTINTNPWKYARK